MADAAEPLYVGLTAEPWLAVAFSPTGFDHVQVFDSVGAAWLAYEETAARILVGVPIGLIESGRGHRECDELAREAVGPQREHIVPPPVREATRKRRFPAATRTHERKAGVRLTERAFAASEAIAAVDELLQELPDARGVFAESHPELCFRAFAGEPLEEPKGTAAGYAERMRTLAELNRDAPPVVQGVAEGTTGFEVSVPDVLDAVALAYTARPGDAPLRSLPEEPPLDAEGLPMAMHYRADAPLVE
ncbi:DUF429 domain-containing protein [Natronomonas sp. EA1]|uniref:DUF429 domain-containing protein n=1 Tax=Natronomonas sp. EA1 TaxID=3421655 RepID=UPI003EB6B971